MHFGRLSLDVVRDLGQNCILLPDNKEPKSNSTTPLVHLEMVAYDVMGRDSEL